MGNSSEAVYFYRKRKGQELVTWFIEEKVQKLLKERKKYPQKRVALARMRECVFLASSKEETLKEMKAKGDA